MRRLPLIFGLSLAIAVPAAALAGSGSAGDGTLVVKNGQAPTATPVVQLTITGSVIGQVGSGKLVIDAGPNADKNSEPQVTGAGLPTASLKSPTAQVWKSSDGFSFRAVGGTYTVLVYGTGVNLGAVGTGTVRLAGQPDTPSGDGRFSLNGSDFASLPGVQSDKRSIGTTVTTTTG
jgi:hypothetical protein